MWSIQSFGESMISDLKSQSNFQVKEEEKIVKSIHKQEIGLLWSTESFEVEYNIVFGISIEFPSQRKKEYFQSAHKQGYCYFVVKRVI